VNQSLFASFSSEKEESITSLHRGAGPALSP
jgi:hypothetical protein